MSASSTELISSMVGTRGKRLGSLGAETSSAGFASTIPSRPIHLKNERSELSARATDVFPSPRSYRCPM